MADENFAKSLLNALKNPEVRSSFGEIVAEQVKNEITLLRKELKEKNEQITKLQQRVSSLESENDSLEQYTRRNSLRVFGVPEEENEDTAQRALSLINQTIKADPPIAIEDIDRVHRIGRRESAAERSGANASAPAAPKPRPIIIKFATYRARHRVMSKRKNLDGSKIYLNEDLTRARATILSKARTMKRQGFIQQAWTHDGAIVFKDSKDKIHSGRSLQECEQLMESFVPHPRHT